MGKLLLKLRFFVFLSFYTAGFGPLRQQLLTFLQSCGLTGLFSASPLYTTVLLHLFLFAFVGHNWHCRSEKHGLVSNTKNICCCGEVNSNKTLL